MSKKKPNIEQALAKITADVMRMNSKEIAELVGSRHDKMKQSIERLVKQGVITQPPVGDESYKDGSGRTVKTKLYLFIGEQGKRDSIIVIAQNSPTFTAALVDRWLELEKCVARLTEEERQRFFDRQALRDEYPPMSEAIRRSKAREGKEAMPHNYSNEANLVNRIIVGMSAKAFCEEHGTASVRDALTPGQTKAMREIQEMNTTLIKLGMPYFDRKIRLEDYYREEVYPRLVAELAAMPVKGSVHA